MKPGRMGPFPYTPQYARLENRPKIVWPGGARLALWVIPNIEVFALDERMPEGQGRIPDVFAYAKRDYGARVGVFRIMEVLAAHGVRGTVALNSEVCDAYPQIMEEAMKLGWEFMGHNQSNTRRLNEIDPATEQEVIRDTLATIRRSTGEQPVGWLGSGLQETWNTLDHLVGEGCLYVADWVSDDQPFLMDVGGRRLVGLPYSGEINDKPAYETHHRTAEEFEAMIRRQFDVLYREGARSGRVMAIALHPYLTGVPHRIDALDEALTYICAHEGVWLATGKEIVQHYLSSGATF